MTVAREDWIPEIPFDMADWGDRYPQPQVPYKSMEEIRKNARDLPDVLREAV